MRKNTPILITWSDWKIKTKKPGLKLYYIVLLENVLYQAITVDGIYIYVTQVSDTKIVDFLNNYLPLSVEISYIAQALTDEVLKKSPKTTFLSIEKVDKILSKETADQSLLGLPHTGPPIDVAPAAIIDTRISDTLNTEKSLNELESKTALSTLGHKTNTEPHGISTNQRPFRDDERIAFKNAILNELYSSMLAKNSPIPIDLNQIEPIKNTSSLSANPSTQAELIQARSTAATSNFSFSRNGRTISRDVNTDTFKPDIKQYDGGPIIFNTGLPSGPGKTASLLINSDSHLNMQSTTDHIDLQVQTANQKIFFSGTVDKAISLTPDTGILDFPQTDAQIKLKDSAGVNRFKILNSSGATVFSVDSLGGVTLPTSVNTSRRRLLNPIADAVPGQPGTYYIDKGITALGYNIAYDAEGIPLITVIIGGSEQFWGPAANFLTPGVPADFDIVRSLSTGPEGFSATGSKNAIKFNGNPTQAIWYYYQRDSLATS